MHAVTTPAGWRAGWRRRATSAWVALPLSLVAVASLSSAAAATPAGDRSPVDLSTPVDFAQAVANRSADVRSGDVRIEVLSPTLLRLEYSPTARFENLPTVNALHRRMSVPPYRAQVADGWLIVRTSRAVLRYRVGSGPFTTANTTLAYSVGGHRDVVRPAWDWICTFDQVCQAGSAELGGGDSFSQTQAGYESTAGYVGYMLEPGTRATWPVLGAPAGPAVVTLRYSNVPVPPTSPVVRNFDLLVNGHEVTTLTAARTDEANPWTTVSTDVDLRSGVNSIEVRCGTGEGCDTDIDTMSVAPVGAPTPVPQRSGPLGGWIRGFDTATYNDLPTCSAGQQGATCQADIQPLNTDGLFDTAGWRLLDDTQSAVWTRQGWVVPRGSGGDQEDGYLFVYGHDYAGALRTLAQLTGPAPATAQEPLRGLVLRLHPVLERHHRALRLPRLRREQRAPQHAVARHGLEGPERLERVGVERLALPRCHCIPAWARSHGRRCHLERPFEHRGQRSEAAGGPADGRRDAGQLTCFGRELQGLGLELGRPGRIELLAATELRASGGGLLVARLVL